MTGYCWQGERVRLRPMHIDDVKLWLEEEQSDSEAVRFLNYGMTLPKSEHDAKAFAERYAEFNNRDERIMFSVETLDAELIGAFNIHSMDRKNRMFETGSRIYCACRGQGYGFEAKGLFVTFLRQSQQNPQLMNHRFKHARSQPALRLLVDDLPGWKILATTITNYIAPSYFKMFCHCTGAALNVCKSHTRVYLLW